MTTNINILWTKCVSPIMRSLHFAKNSGIHHRYLFIFLISGLAFLANPNNINAQLCTPGTLTKWNLHKQDSNCSSDIHISNGGFNATSVYHQGCSSVAPSTVYRNVGGSSCVDGIDGNSTVGDAACTGDWTGNSWQDNSSKAIRFSVTLTAGNTGQLSYLKFYELAPVHDSRWGYINYPTKYGMRVLKDGVEIFQQIDIPTTTSWSQEVFDFRNNSDFEYTGTATFDFELMAYSPVGNGYSYYIWDLDEIQVKGCCGTPVCQNVTDGGTITGDESMCGSYDPGMITSTAMPSGGSGALEYVWLSSTIGCPDGQNSTVIAGATGSTYNPGVITETTYYLRCARRAGCIDYPGESNCVVKEVLAGPTISTVFTIDPGCDNNDGRILISVVGGPADYEFNIGSGWFPQMNIFSGLTAGTYTIAVRKLDGTCMVMDTPVTLTAPQPSDCNGDPVAVDDSNSTLEETPINGNVSLNDSDPDNDDLTYTLISNPSNGTLSFSPDGTYTYTPGPQFFGTVTFVYEVSDGNGGTDQATVTIEVLAMNDQPTAVDDTNSGPEDTPVSGTVASNDSDPDNDPLTFTQLSSPANGQLIFDSNGSYTYTPNADFNGVDSFQYQVSDGNGGTDIATVVLTITPENDTPKAVDDTEAVEENETLMADVSPNDSDPDNDPLSFTLVNGTDNGTLMLNSNGTYSYTPNTGFTGTDTFSYEVSDGQGGTDQAIVTITVTACAPPITGIEPIPDVCALESVQIVARNAGPGATYLWDFGPDATPSTSTSIFENVIYATTGQKTVSLVVTLNGCSTNAQRSVTVTPAVTADGGVDRTICKGESTQLGGAPSGPSGAHYVWVPSTGLNDQMVANPIATPSNTTTYTVFVTLAGCTRTADVTIEVEVIECLDTDMDGIPDVDDIDDDNDGILDVTEADGNDPSADDDNDGILNYLDPDYPGYTDTNNDGVNDNLDTDFDGIPDHLDLDADNDGTSDVVEAGNGDKDTNGDGTISTDDTNGGDSDNDGLVDSLDPDNTGVPLEQPNDFDEDGKPDFVDLDSDNDGIADVEETGNGDLDTNDDGMIDSTDFNGADSDGDGLADSLDPNIGFGADPGSQSSQPDQDEDGQPNFLDLDSDNDGVTDVVEGGNADADTNGDGILDTNDTNGDDSDGDGLVDAIDTFPGIGNTNGDQGAGPDTDEDQIPDALDLDSDNDGVTDVVESGNEAADTNDDGILDDNDMAGTDSDGDGIADAVDTVSGLGAADNTQGDELDTDDDGSPDYIDLDSDNDGITDVIENGNDLADSNDDGVIDQSDIAGGDIDKDGLVDALDNEIGLGGTDGSQPEPQDTDNDGAPDYIDLDADNDGIADVVESGNTAADTNNDGVLDSNDTNGGDDDGDGLVDAVDGMDGIGSDNNSQTAPQDSDDDGVSDFVDIDSDNDGIADIVEAGLEAADTNGNGVIDSNDTNGGDADNDGIADSIDDLPGIGVVNGSQTTPTDFDMDNVPDYLDIDSDNDGITDVIEGGNILADTNMDGFLDSQDANGADTDGDGLVDALDTNTGIGATNGTQGDVRDTDGDEAPDYRDLDSDNDSVVDLVEAGFAFADTNMDGVIDIDDADGTDFDGDGLVNAIDGQFGVGSSPGTQDGGTSTDNDGLPDFLDIDSDNDGDTDIMESGNGIFDTNKNGVIDAGDINGIDSDNDGVVDILDGSPGVGTADGKIGPVRDTDQDLVPDMLDLDSDNDGIADLQERGLGDFDTNNDGTLDDMDAAGSDNDQDGLADALDTTTGIGGALNTQGNDLDTDEDLIPDHLDLDSDNDGITDVIESGNGAADTNLDGVINTFDTNGADTDRDGLFNAVDGNPGFADAPDGQGDALDTDTDMVPDHLDIDSDNDGIADVIESGNGDADTNKDGVLGVDDANGTDSDGDGLVNAVDASVGFGDVVLGQADIADTDTDGTPDYRDIDSDNDGIADVIESGNGDADTNLDGTIDANDANGDDADGDGLADAVDGTVGVGDADAGQADITDTDSDTTPDHLDIDSDNDGITDVVESGSGDADTNQDGILNALDTNGGDADNDGLSDAVDGNTTGFGDQPNGQGDIDDTDGDLVFDHQDIDSDNDGIADVIEGGNEAADTNLDGTIDVNDLNGDDNDGDGLVDSVDGEDGFGDELAGQGDITNTDSDDVLDFKDLDSDNDGITDIHEAGNGAFDTNNDGTLSSLDTNGADTDGDGLADAVDGEPGFGDAPSGQDDIADTDGDSQPNHLDLDTDNDGIADVIESGNEAADTNLDGTIDTDDANGADADGDGLADDVDGNGGGFADAANGQGDETNTDTDDIPNYQDLDSDNDGLTDLHEAGYGLLDTDQNGTFTPTDAKGVDTDNDGLADAVDDSTGFADADNGQGNLLNTDGDASPDHLDLDSDNDGLTDLHEAGNATSDTNNNGTLDLGDGAFGVDTDNDGLADGVDGSAVFADNAGAQGNALNTDNDLNPDHLDLDSDNDGLTDVQESGNGAFDTNLDGTLDAEDTSGADTDLDGLADAVDGNVGFADADNGQGDALDSDNDFAPNHLDLDSDNDGIVDLIENGNFALDSDMNGTLDANDSNGGDSDKDGLADSVDDAVGFADADFAQFALSFDGDNIPNYIDLDSDNDGISDLTEAAADLSISDTRDTNNDGLVDGIDNDNDGLIDQIDSFVGFAHTVGESIIPANSDTDVLFNYLDIDADDDGILDNSEAQATLAYVAPAFNDTDGDGLDDAYDLDNTGFGGGFSYLVVNTDLTGLPDYLDLDTDDDGELDAVEGHDLDGDGIPEVVAGGGDADNDGLLDNYDTNIPDLDPTDGGLSPNSYPDADGGDPELDWRENFACINIQLAVFLEGGLSDKDNIGMYLAQMRSDLNTERSILPGQTPVNPLVSPTPPGQPYFETPWGYMGTEGLTWTNTEYQNIAATYGSEVVDWVLISFRKTIDQSSEVAEAAALVLQDGTVVFVDECVLSTNEPGPLYVVVEHRNHLGIMSENPVTIDQGSLIFDFRVTNSFVGLQIPVTGFGQKQVNPGVWAMYTGDGDQASDITSYDITGLDKILWEVENGNFDQYLLSDFNLNGDSNGADKILWSNNNGISSRVPK